jgi:hypothetical protein
VDAHLSLPESGPLSVAGVLAADAWARAEAANRIDQEH